MNEVLERIQNCEVCKKHIPFGVRPVVRLNPFSKVVIIGQAPGRLVHETGIPWNDASGRKLRAWLGVDEHTFYDSNYFSILPMGFCYPGKGVSGDLPPRPECAPLWHAEIFKHFDKSPLVLLIGQYAQKYYLKNDFRGSLTETVKNYRQFLPDYFPLPHPSPRNQNWVKVNTWFPEDVLPELRKRIEAALLKG